ncbi:DUF262 domain-containing protein [Herbaspirillum sp. NPDC101397]|uniref:DUF262 domain-containing protein n=1 Tax=Herbaspirillum sp. NPDC101397 TaxID=3364006 RepID=UPI00383BBD02
MADDIEPEEADLLVDEEVDETGAFVTYDIASYPSDLTLWGIKEMWDEGDILIPGFQRKYVWKISQASLLIESFLLGLPVPQVFFYVDDDNKSLIIDGQQRILSMIFFFEGYFGHENTHGRRQIFRLTGLDERSPFANKRYEDLEEPVQRKLRNAVLRAINIRQLSPKSEHTSIYHIFERLNTGGTPLKPQEIRNCVFRGSLGQYLRDLNKDPAWRLIIGKRDEDKHQKDVELILRLYALSGSGSLSYEKPMKEYLNVAMANDLDGKAKHSVRFINRFSKVCKVIAKELRPKPFHLRGPLNSSVLDSVFCTLLDNFNAIPDDLARRYAALSKNKAFLEDTYYGTSDVTVLQRRFTTAKQFLID